jgi:hypothetical protein
MGRLPVKEFRVSGEATFSVITAGLRKSFDGDCACGVRRVVYGAYVAAMGVSDKNVAG